MSPISTHYYISLKLSKKKKNKMVNNRPQIETYLAVVYRAETAIVNFLLDPNSCMM